MFNGKVISIDSNQIEFNTVIQSNSQQLHVAYLRSRIQQ
jgi:hypothetical protein